MGGVARTVSNVVSHVVSPVLNVAAKPILSLGSAVGIRDDKLAPLLTGALGAVTLGPVGAGLGLGAGVGQALGFAGGYFSTKRQIDSLRAQREDYERQMRAIQNQNAAEAARIQQQLAAVTERLGQEEKRAQREKERLQQERWQKIETSNKMFARSVRYNMMRPIIEKRKKGLLNSEDSLLVQSTMIA